MIPSEKKIIQSLYNKNKIESDDCYLWNKNYLITTDSIAEGNHFLDKWSTPEDIATKLIEVNISDIIASGGIPTHVFFNLGIPKQIDRIWLTHFIKKFKSLLRKYHLILAGGDTFRANKKQLSCTMIGKVISPFLRKNCITGEYVYITGPLGYSYLGYKTLKEEKYNRFKKSLTNINNYSDDIIIRHAISKHLAPISQFDLMMKINRLFTINSAIDISDGLVQDLQNLSFASGKGFVIQLDALPDFGKLRNYLSVNEITNSGEELQILFTSPQNDLENQFKISPKVHQQIKLIGGVTKKKEIKFSLNERQFTPSSQGFFHF